MSVGPDLPDYPRDSPPEDRLAAYVEAIRLNGGEGMARGDHDLTMPSDWEHYLDSARRRGERNRERVDQALGRNRTAPSGPSTCARCHEPRYERTLDARGICASCRLEETEPTEPVEQLSFSEPLHPQPEPNPDDESPLI